MVEFIMLGIGLLLIGFLYESNRVNTLNYQWRRNYISQIIRSENNIHSIIYYDHNGNAHIINISELQDNTNHIVDYSNIIDNYTKRDIAEYDMGYCPISLDSIKPGDTIRTLKCGHKFLLEPIDLWLKNNLECPLCRQQFNKN